MKVWIVVWAILLLLPLYNPAIAVIIALITSIVSFLMYQGSSYGSPYKWMAYSPNPDEIEVKQAEVEAKSLSQRMSVLDEKKDILIPSITFLVFIIDFIWAAIVV